MFSLAHSFYHTALPGYVFYFFSVIFALLGLVGNVLLYRLTRHPKFKGCSFRVYLAFLAVIGYLDLALTLSKMSSDHFQVTHKWLAVDHMVCKSFQGLKNWMKDMFFFGLLGMILDRRSQTAAQSQVLPLRNTPKHNRHLQRTTKHKTLQPTTPKTLKTATPI
ncbi:hypothetical protein ACOMHN_021659 [Nucella lapillus]